METTRGNFGVWLSKGVGIAYCLRSAPVCYIGVGDRRSPEAAADLGLVVGRLTERQIAFLLLLVLEHHGELKPRIIAGSERPQRQRFADYLGMTEVGFRKWIERTLGSQPGRIVRWGHTDLGPRQSRTGGPWSIGVKKPIIEPDSRRAFDFIEGQRRKSSNRRSDPSALLAAALNERDAGEWADAMVLLEEAEQMFRRRRWSRETPLWFEILLVLAGTEMQIGAPGLQPRLSANIARSVSRQRLGSARADLIRAQAHYIAALIYNQREDPALTPKLIAHLERARELLEGRTDRAAVREYWKVCSYLEITSSRLTATVHPEYSSKILQAATAYGDESDQNRMRYGEVLLNAGRAAKAVEYIRPALESGRLSKPAWIIAERFDALAQWQLGASVGPTLDELERIERDAEALGFAHQVRTIREAKQRVRRRNKPSRRK